MSTFSSNLSFNLQKFESEINNISTISNVIKNGWNDSKADELLQIISRVKSDAYNVINAGNETVNLINRYL